MCKHCIAETCLLSVGTLVAQAWRAFHLHCPFWGSLSLLCPARVQSWVYLLMPGITVIPVGPCHRAQQASVPIQGPLYLTWKQYMGHSSIAQMAVASALTSISMWLQQIGSTNRRHTTAPYRREVACLHLVVILKLTAPPRGSGLRLAAATSSSSSGLPLQAAGLRYRTLLVCFRLLLRAVRPLQLGQVSPRLMTLA